MLSNKLNEILPEKGIKVSQFSKKCGISYPYLRKIIKGDCNPSLAFQNRIAKALNLTVEEIFPNEKKS